MTVKQKRRIEETITNLKKENALRKLIYNPHNELTEMMNEGQRSFIYIEMPNTKPIVAYAFNINDSVIVGRGANECTVVINEPSVSRKQCMIFVENNNIVVQDLEAKNPTVYKNGFSKYKLGFREKILLFKDDILIIGGIKIRVLLVRGDAAVLN
jgi:hypothetical protein